ncbi:MAG TPA: sodium:solute symporter [Verrucomicrobiae bacterium]|jgi:Na+/proline symporter|nr:sodium:solute symporter [Verrucomicrobiae bacterium]
MSPLDFVVLIASMLGIAGYGIWRTRGPQNLKAYLKGDGRTPWFAIGLSVMATQASAITFLSTPGQGYLGGLAFVQIYFGMPIALIIIAAVFLPIFRRLNVYTAYEFLGKRFDPKTRLLGVAIFLLQRGLGAGLTIYAPAIVLTTVFGWPLNLTIICSGVLVIIYTVIGGSDAVTVTQKYQLGIIFAGMIAAFCLLVMKLPAGMGLGDITALAGGFHKLKAVNFSTDVHERYTFWSGLLGGTFLMLSYFGTDQSQVQRYIGGASLREGRLGLMFNAVCKIPMQFFILFLGVLLFVFYQFEPPPLFFDPASKHYSADEKLRAYETEFNSYHAQTREALEAWLNARHHGDASAAAGAFTAASTAHEHGEEIRKDAAKELQTAHSGATANDADYVFITFILHQLPHGVIGLLVAAFFAAALSSKAAELNALSSTTTIDFYRNLINRDATDHACLIASKWFTALWGFAAIGFALYAHLVENLIQAVNILGSIFYGVLLGLFVVAFFVKRVGGSAVFWGALVAQALVCVLYFKLTISYLWYPLIGCAACVAFSLMFQTILGSSEKTNPIPAS